MEKIFGQKLGVDLVNSVDRMTRAAELFANGAEATDGKSAAGADVQAAGTTTAGDAAVDSSTASTAGSSSSTTTASGADSSKPDVQGTMQTAGQGMLKGQFDDAMGVFGAPTEMPGWFNAGQDLLGQLAPAGIAAGKAAFTAAGFAPGAAVLDMLAPFATGKDPEPKKDDQGAAVTVPADATAGAGDAVAPDSTATTVQPVSTQTAGDGTTYQIVVQSMGQAYEAVKHLQARELAGFGAHR